jgi:prepilin-type N-terminal cleavage/methylation domain-containing protein
MRNKQKGFSLIELLIVVAIILIIAAIAIPNLLRSKMAANEASAVASLRTLNTTQVLYSTNCNIGFSVNLTALGPATTAGTPDCTTGEDLVDAVMSGENAADTTASATTFTKSGYLFTYTPTGTPPSTYTITASPSTYNGSGIRGFFTDQSGVIHADAVGSTNAAATDPPL